MLMTAGFAVGALGRMRRDAVEDFPGASRQVACRGLANLVIEKADLLGLPSHLRNRLAQNS